MLACTFSFSLLVDNLRQFCFSLFCFQASTSASGNSSNSNTASSSVSGLTGWAAFGAKTSTAAPSTAKLGSTVQTVSGKPTAPSSNQKAVGLSGLAPSKASLGSKASTSINSSTGPVKPLPPLTLGKPSLNRSSSNDNVSNSVGQASSGNGGTSSTNNGGNNGAKTSSDSSNPPVVKLPTSQESQLNAMKRLQMVKKKAAQKKLKKWMLMCPNGCGSLLSLCFYTEKQAPHPCQGGQQTCPWIYTFCRIFICEKITDLLSPKSPMKQLVFSYWERVCISLSGHNQELQH